MCRDKLVLPSIFKQVILHHHHRHHRRRRRRRIVRVAVAPLHNPWRSQISRAWIAVERCHPPESC